MIILTKLNDVPFALNCDLIETVQSTPDTTVRLTDGNVYIVKETLTELVDKVIDYRRRLFRGAFTTEKWDD